jgi:hypothetical protein
MDKDKCGKFGCYGFQDGYLHPQRVCRISGCVDANECSNKLKADLAGKGKDYIMSIFQNKEKGIQERENEAKIREFDEKEKLRIAKEKMEADEKVKKESEEKSKKEQAKTADELKERAKKVGLPETATQVEVEAKEKESKDLKDAEELKGRAVKIGLPETATLAEVEAKEKETTPPKVNLEEIKDVVKVPRTVYDDKCPHCGELIHEKGVYSEDNGKTMRHGACKGAINVDVKAPVEKPAEPEKPEEKPKEEIKKPEEKPAEKPAEEVKPKEDESKSEEKK